MKKTFLLAAAIISTFSFQFSTLRAQTDPVVMEVGGKQIRQSEFMKDFLNNGGRQFAAKPNVTAAEKRATFDEYVELYANFRAKELDARSMGMDTTPSLKKELASYRKDLAAPYLMDASVMRRLLDEAYERNHYSLRAAHILVYLPPNADPADTLEAYNRAWELWRRIDGGEDFNNVAYEEIHRQNPQAPSTPIEGDLGYFSVFDMIYPFESAAYALELDQVSKPIRTRYGYHIIHLLDKVDGIYGRVTMAHIWLNSNDSTHRSSEIRRMYDMLVNGTPFEVVARQSDDRSTADEGGVLADARLSNLPPEYIHTIAHMNEGEISKPFFTQYGWHIVKMINREHLKSKEEMEPYYKQRMARDQRGIESKHNFAVQCREKYGITDYTVTPEPTTQKAKSRKQQQPKMMASLDELLTVLPDSVFRGLWRPTYTEFSDLRPLVSVPGKDYTVVDVARYIQQVQKRERPSDKQKYIQKHYSEFLDSVTLAYADSQLEAENPEFAEIVEDYRRGLMIFNYNDKMIWTKAIKDSVGFAEFYAKESATKDINSPEDSIFFWRTRARVTIVDIKNDKALDKKKALKIATKAHKKHLGSSAIREQMMKQIDAKQYKPADIVATDVEVVEQAHQNLLTDEQWKPGVYTVDIKGGYRLLVVDEILKPMLKEQMEARGYYLNAWQNEVERRLISDLRAKYNVKINYDALSKITY